MNSAEYVGNLITDLKGSGVPLSDVAWKASLACVGWPYVFGARGEYCTPANRRRFYKESHPTIKSKCKNYSGSGTCSGCKWLPGGKKVRFFDCRGFTYWILLQVFGWKLMGAGATSQWNTESNWTAKGTIDSIPENTLVCLFVADGKTMQHTGFGYHGETIECSSGVQHFTSRKAKWTHWAAPACLDAQITPSEPDPEDSPVEDRPTLRRGNKGESVRVLQTLLSNLGYDLGSCGIDGDFGRATEAAVKAFQTDAGITVDGVVGKNTWAALDGKKEPEKDPVTEKYSVFIPSLSLSEAQAIVAKYSGAYMTAEGGE